MLYKIRNFCPIEVLISLYYSLFHCHLSYGISIWGVANKTLLEKVFLLQKKAIRAITKSDFLAHTDPLFKKLRITKLNDLYFIKLASLMWDYDNDVIPSSLNVWFSKIPRHNYQTRFVTKGKLQPCNIKTKKYGIRSFKYEGTLFLNQLKDLDFYESSVTKRSFLDKLKTSLLDLYN